MKRKRERKNCERGRAKRMVLLHFEERKREFLLQFWRKKKAENFEVGKLIFFKLIAGIFEVSMADFGVENSRFLLLKLCEFAAGNFGGFAAIKGQQSAANLCRKIGAICCQFVQKHWSCLCKKIGVVCCRKIRTVCAEKLELFAANLCRKIGQHCAANLREKKTAWCCQIF
ncbi:Uncharacterized protein TCM_023033 [Theobroma cacao]|uniref:Uncharacterized protein n=1 Tax=Theobroma cacao TaxID=3641 RepID=A0A061F1W8_THECC|nr:Uncharacterized protein TCM_023033 [Theobroma cacao]